MSLNSELKKILESIIEKSNVDAHPFFKMLEEGRMSKEKFIQSQIEFAPIVQFFNRPMALLISNIPDPLLRMPLVENLWEEHGNGNLDNIHGKTILTLIDRLGGNSISIDETPHPVNVKVFNDALRGIAAFESYQFACAVFSGVERIFVNISDIIYKSIVKQKWLEECDIIHYGLHKEIDIHHSEEFLSIVNQDWENGNLKDEIEDGIKLGVDLLLNLYTALHHNLCQNE